jgi:methionyl-tRNA formyltransferase
MTPTKTSAVVFAYHDVGVRCLKVLINAGIEVKLVVSHQDSPKEKIWFGSVVQVANEYGIAVVTPEDPNNAQFIEQLTSLKIDYIFSFYYRMMLSPAVLSTAKRSAFNMHGSLLPKYRGRVPLNWAMIKGESEAGATLHVMTPKPDAGEILDKMSIPILVNDTAQEVFQKMVVAAEIVLHRSIDLLKGPHYPLLPNDLSQGNYFGGRKPDDGKINITDLNTRQIHDLIRAVAPPYPGAFLVMPGDERKFFIYRTLFWQNSSGPAFQGAPVIYQERKRFFLQTEKLSRIEILECAFEKEEIQSASDFFIRNNLTANQPWEIL